MATKLEELLDDIHPRNTIDATARRADGAIERFASQGMIDDIELFSKHMIDFKRVCVQDMLRLPDGPPEASRWLEESQCRDVLTEAFGPNGFRVAFDMARTGAEGGLYRVLKEFATTMAGQFTRNEIAAKVNRYWNDLTVEEKLAAAEEYLEKYANVIQPGYAWNVRCHFRDALLKHPTMIQQLERIGRD